MKSIRILAIAVLFLAYGKGAIGADSTKPEDVVELYKRNGTWQEKTPGEQEGFLRHMHEEHVTPEDIGKMATKAGVKAVILSHYGPALNPDDENVFSFLRRSPDGYHAILVALNMTPAAQAISFDLGAIGHAGALLKPLVVSPSSQELNTVPPTDLKLSPYGIFIGEIVSHK